MSHFNQFDVVVVPFPYSDMPKTKKRPALVISGSSNIDKNLNHCVCVMITSFKNNPWPLDVEIKDLKSSGLPAPSVIRMKLFTIDQKLILSKIGQLGSQDTESVKKSLKKLIPIL